MEREIMFTGIGGQGVQLGAQILGLAATREDRHVMLFGTYGGSMRGGNTDSTLVVADAPISSPPIVSTTWAAVSMHHQYWEPMRRKLTAGSVVFLNSTLFEEEFDRIDLQVIEVPATELATEIGTPLAGSMAMVGAVAAATSIVGIDSLVQAMEESLPGYRKQHAADNEKALRAGFEFAETDVAPAWTQREDSNGDG